jgi:hypothetical protein
MFGRDLAELPDCPECGTQIYARKHLRLGNRQPRRAAGWAALSLALLALVASIGFSGRWAQGYDWNRVKPVSWLIREASDASNPNRGDAALDELDRRFEEDLLSLTELDQLVNAALDYQADTSKPWDDLWGKWVEQMRAEELASDKQWRRYITQASDFDLLTRKRIGEGYHVVITSSQRQHPFRAKLSDVLFEEEGSWLRPFHSEDATIEIRAIAADGSTGPVLVTLEMGLTPGWTYFGAHDETGRAYELKPGRYQLKAEGQYVWPDPSPKNVFGEMKSDKRTTTTTFEVFPDNHQLIKPVRNLKLAKQTESLMMQGLQQPIFGNPRIRHRSRGDIYSIAIGIPGANLPCWCSFDVEIYVEGEPLGKAGEITIEPNTTNNHFSHVEFPIPDEFMAKPNSDAPPKIDELTLRLVPNPEHLKEQLDGYDYLDHVIEIKDIPVKPYRP